MMRTEITQTTATAPTASVPPDSFYVTGGTVPQDAACYVSRQADIDLLEGLRQGQFCYVLTSRQMGKSSLMVRATQRLRQEGVVVAVLDLTAIGQNVTAEQWYFGLLRSLSEQLELEEALREYWRSNKEIGPLQRFLGALREVVIEQVAGQLVILVDEVDTVRSLSFSTDEFFAGIRECYNRRTQDPQMQRLCFGLFGVASPSDLIQDVRTTPFNIGRRIELRDFTAEEASILAQGLGGGGREGKRLLQRVLYWTGGHPYLTQRLCQAVAEYRTAATSARVNQHCAEMFFSARSRENEDNLLFVSRRLLESEVDRSSLLDLYDKVRAGKRVEDEETNPLVSVLRLSGIVKAEQGRLKVRNRIYSQVFDRIWVQAHLPNAELERQKAAYRRGLLRAVGASSLVIAVMAALLTYALLQKHAADGKTKEAQGLVVEARNQADTTTRLLYIANMNLIQRAWEGEPIHVGRVLELLEETRSYKDRGFEWDYWKRLCHLDLLTLKGHTDRVTSVAFSPGW